MDFESSVIVRPKLSVGELPGVIPVSGGLVDVSQLLM